jgi:hypothetical protein
MQKDGWNEKAKKKRDAKKMGNINKYISGAQRRERKRDIMKTK